MADAKYAVSGREMDAFDRVAANLEQQWYDDGLGGGKDRWENQPGLYKVSYLAVFAGAMDVSFERFAAAAHDVLGLEPGQEFTPDHNWSVKEEYYRAWKQYGHGRVERVEEMLQTLKARTDFVEETNYVDTGTGFSLALGHLSIGHSWDQLTDDQKLGQIFRCTDFASLKHPEKMAIIAREVDVTRLTPAARGWLPWELRKAAGEGGRAGQVMEMAPQIPSPAGNAMPDFRADVFDALMTRLEAFGDEFARLARTKQQKVLAEAFSELVADVHKSITYIAEASRQYGPPETGLSEPPPARVTSPTDLVEGNGAASQQLVTPMKADQPARYASPPESIELARETMRDIKVALIRDAGGNFPASYAAMDWDGMNMQPHETAWQDMDLGQRYDLLLHVLDESIWDLEPSAKWDEPRDSQKLAIDFVKEDARQAMPGFRADAFDALTTRLEAFADEFARLARTDGQTALAETFQTFVGEAQWTIARLAEVRPPANPDAFDRLVADLPRQWYEDGHGDGVETWEQQSAVEKIGYLAGHAAAHNVSFERFVEASARTLGLASGEEFTPVEVQHLLHQIRWAHGDFSDDRAGLSAQPSPKNLLSSIAAFADERDGMPTPEEWRKLLAEWSHDYGLRRLEERGVSYEDEAERSLDLADGGGKGEGQENKRVISPADLAPGTGPAAQKQTRGHRIGI